MLPGYPGLEYGAELASIREKFIAVMYEELEITDDINQGSEMMNQIFQRMLEPETDVEPEGDIDYSDFPNSSDSISSDTSDLSFLSNLSRDEYIDNTSTTESSTGDVMEDAEVSAPPKKIRKRKRERKQVAYFCY